MKRVAAVLIVCLLLAPDAAAAGDVVAANWFTRKWEQTKAKGAAAWESTKAGLETAWSTAKITALVVGAQMEASVGNTIDVVKDVFTPDPGAPPPPPKPPEVICAEQGLAWNGQSCIHVQPVEELPPIDCASRGQYWDGTACRSPGPPPQPAPPAQPCQAGQYYDPVLDECWRSKLDYDIQTCADSGRIWVENACRTEDQAAQAACQAEGGRVNSDDRLCYLREDVAVVCEEQGALWVAREQRCYVGNAGDIPRGLERFYFVVRTPQEKALYGAYRDAVTKGLYDQEAALRDAVSYKNEEAKALLANQEAELRAYYEQRLADLDAEAAELIEDLGKDFDAQREDYEQAIAAYEKSVAQLQQVNTFLHDRLDRSQYGGSVPPDGALGALKRIAGRGAEDVEISFPNGMPTPVESSDGNSWTVTVPVAIRFPTLSYQDATVMYRADKLLYIFSSNGGRSSLEGEQLLDFEAAGAQAQSFQIRLQASFPKGANTYDLELRSALVYSELYAFAEGADYELPSYREAPPLTRSFFTSANPIGSGAAADSIQAYEPDDATAQQRAAEDGSSPGGAARAYNWAAQQRSQLDQGASAMDQDTGLGLRLLVRHMEWIFAGIAVIVAYFLGYLDFIPPLKRLRNRNKPSDPFQLDEQLMEGL